jgi:hypothetical protein
MHLTDVVEWAGEHQFYRFSLLDHSRFLHLVRILTKPVLRFTSGSGHPRPRWETAVFRSPLLSSQGQINKAICKYLWSWMAMGFWIHKKLSTILNLFGLGSGHMSLYGMGSDGNLWWGPLLCLSGLTPKLWSSRQVSRLDGHHPTALRTCVAIPHGSKFASIYIYIYIYIYI